MGETAARRDDDDGGMDRPGQAGLVGDIDVVQIGAALGRNRWRILLPTLLAALASFAVATRLEPRFTGEARILLQSGDSYYTRPGGSSDRDGSIDERDVVSQVQVITSRDLAREAIARLGLKDNPAFDPSARPQPLRRVLERYGLLAPLSEQRAAEKLIEEFRDRVVAFPVLQSRVLVVEFTAYDPELAARGANMVADLFLDSQVEAKTQSARSASTWLKDTIDPLRAKVAEAEARVEAFRARSGLILGTNNATLQQQQMADMNAQLSAARSAQADAQARARMLREALKGARPLEVSEIANNELVRKLAADQSALRAQIALESRTLLPGHPRIKELNAQLATVESEIRASAEKAARTMENDALVSRVRVESLEQSLDALKQQNVAGAESEVTLRGLEREARALRDQLDTLTTRYRDAEARDGRDATPADARIISRADVPGTPSFPRTIPIVVVSTLGVFVLAVSLVITSELLSGRAMVEGGTARRARRPETFDWVDMQEERLSFPPPSRHSRHVAEETGGPAPQQSPVSPADAVAPVSTSVGPPVRPVQERRADAEAAPIRAMVPPARPPRASMGAVDDGSSQVMDLLSMSTLLLAMREVSGGGFVCLVGAQERRRARDGALRLARHVARGCRTVLVDASGAAGLPGQSGVRDLGRRGLDLRSTIHRDPRSPLHLVGPGSPAAGEPLREAVAQAIEALRLSYDCVIVCGDLPGDRPGLSRWLAGAVETLVIVADSELAAAPVEERFREVRPDRDRPFVMSPHADEAVRLGAVA